MDTAELIIQLRIAHPTASPEQLAAIARDSQRGGSERRTDAAPVPVYEPPPLADAEQRPSISVIREWYIAGLTTEQAARDWGVPQSVIAQWRKESS